MEDAKPFEQTWLEETKYGGCLGKDWDNPANWEKELRTAKPKTVRLAIESIEKIQPRLVGLFLAFKAQTRREEFVAHESPAVIPDSTGDSTIIEKPSRNEASDTIRIVRLQNDEIVTPDKSCLSTPMHLMIQVRSISLATGKTPARKRFILTNAAPTRRSKTDTPALFLKR